MNNIFLTAVAARDSAIRSEYAAFFSLEDIPILFQFFDLFSQKNLQLRFFLLNFRFPSICFSFFYREMITRFNERKKQGGVTLAAETGSGNVAQNRCRVLPLVGLAGTRVLQWDLERGWVCL